MGIRFRKTISLGNGVRANIGKNGISMTYKVGKNSINVGKKGTYVNIPLGNGLFIREKIK